MNTGSDDAPRMTSADADARFAALVAQYRNEKQRGAGRGPGGADDQRAAIGLLLVYCLGVGAGAFWHAAPLVAIAVGAPVVYFVRFLRKRSRDRLDAA